MAISGGMPTIFVRDMDAAVRFYVDALGLKLLERYGDHWASIDCGHGLTIGLHPASAQNPAGRAGSMTIGFRTSEPIRETVATLEARGVVFRGDVVDDTQLLIANFQDPDGLPGRTERRVPAQAAARIECEFVALAPHGAPTPVTFDSSAKNSRFRGELIVQLTGTLWYPSSNRSPLIR